MVLPFSEVWYNHFHRTELLQPVAYPAPNKNDVRCFRYLARSFNTDGTSDSNSSATGPMVVTCS